MELNVKTFAASIIGIVVMILLTTAILVPVAESSTHNTYSNKENISEILDYVDGSEEHRLENNSGTYKFDGNSIYFARIYTDHGYIFATNNSVQGRIAFGDVTTTSITDVAALESVQLTAGSISVVIGGVTQTVDLGWAYVTDSAGNWGVITDGTTECYVKDLDELKWIRYFSSYLAVMEGNSAIYHNDTYSDYLVVDELDDGAKIVTLPAQVSAQWSVGTPIVKLSVQSDAIDSPVAALISIIPLLVFVGIALAAIGVFITRRD